MTSRPQEYADRVYRSGSGLAGGVLLLALAAWLGGDAVIRGEGRTPLVALAALFLAVPLVVAFTLRPAVFAGDDRLRVRNPFRTITLPWAAVETLRADLSSEVLADGRKYQLWAIPVSLRQRKRAERRARQAASGQRSRGLVGAALSAGDDADGSQASADRTIEELRQLAAARAGRDSAQGPATIRWAYEILTPSAAGAIALAVLLTVG